MTDAELFEMALTAFRAMTPAECEQTLHRFAVNYRPFRVFIQNKWTKQGGPTTAFTDAVIDTCRQVGVKP